MNTINLVYEIAESLHVGMVNRNFGMPVAKIELYESGAIVLLSYDELSNEIRLLRTKLTGYALICSISINDPDIVNKLKQHIKDEYDI